MREHLISDEFKKKLKEVNDNFIEKYGTYLPKDDYAKETNMNKYLFRGIRKDNGKWIEGGYCYCNNKSYIVIATRYIPDTRDWDTANYYEENPVYEPTFIEVYTKTVGQWTGLTDKNGIKIFKGDICQTKGYALIDSDPFIIVWEDYYNGWYWQDIETPRDTDMLTKTVAELTEVVGNIYGNTELLNN